MKNPNPTTTGAINRRQSLQFGAASAAAGLIVAATDTTQPVQAATTPGTPVLPPFTQPFIQPLPVYTAKLPTALSNLNPPPKHVVDPADPGTPLVYDSLGRVVSGGRECGRPDHQRADTWPSQKYYVMRVREAMHTFHPVLPSQKIWGYDGVLPGPTFVARYGEPITVRIYNDLPVNANGYGTPEISTHLHNLHDGSESDGFTGDYYSATKFGPTMTAPGNFKDHHYVNCYAGYDEYAANNTNGDPKEALGTLWYHDHRIDFTAPNVYKGLTGFYLLFDELDSGNENDPNPNALRLPSGVGKYDVPLVFQDKFFDSSGYLAFDQFNTDGILGNKFCVNGKVQPYFKVEPRKYRFRLLSGGPSRIYEFYVTNAAGTNQEYVRISNDGNLYETPLKTKKMLLGVAERGDIILDFSKYAGQQLFIVNRMDQTNGRGPSLSNPRDANGLLTSPGVQLLRFEVTLPLSAPDNSRVPSFLRALPSVTAADIAGVATTRTFVFDRSNGGWTVNGQLFDVSVASATPKQGTSEIWVLKVSGDWWHPVHIHFEEGRILTRNGLPPEDYEQVRKDVYLLKPGDEVRVFLRFRDFLGKYMMHCHNLVHEDHAMMVRWDIVP
jgi:FtsP/CotA-like multicopper oxidase with cupredoxin domain